MYIGQIWAFCCRVVPNRRMIYLPATVSYSVRSGVGNSSTMLPPRTVAAAMAARAAMERSMRDRAGP